MLLSYLADEENAEWTQQRLVPFLQTPAVVCRQERAELQIVAHSMGDSSRTRWSGHCRNKAVVVAERPIWA